MSRVSPTIQDGKKVHLSGCTDLFTKDLVKNCQKSSPIKWYDADSQTSLSRLTLQLVIICSRFLKDSDSLMLKKIFDRLRRTQRTKSSQQIIPASQHPITSKHISSAALRVLEGLHKAGFQSYLVGGSVRDLLLQKTPKDFDVATNATPEQVRQIFRSSRIIGRRFRLVHVQFGRETIEVATFRAHHESSEKTSISTPHAQRASAQTNASGMIVRDNVYGSIVEDAERRDFSINALYYKYPEQTVHDFTEGVADLRLKRLRLIGHPETRFREDPVRILRTIRFAAKLGFTIDPATAEPIPTLAPLLTHISPHRLFDEMLKLFACGHSQQVLRLLLDYDLLKLLCMDLHLNDQFLKLVDSTAINTDLRIAEGKSINPAFFIAALLWQKVQEKQLQLVNHGVAHSPAWQQASHQILQTQMQRTALTKSVQSTLREIWELQVRLEHPDFRNVPSLIQHPRFRAAFDFLVLREKSGEKTNDMGEWWERYQAAEHGLQVEMLRHLQDKTTPSKKSEPRSRRRKKTTNKKTD